VGASALGKGASRGWGEKEKKVPTPLGPSKRNTKKVFFWIDEEKKKKGEREKKKNLAAEVKRGKAGKSGGKRI